MSYYGGCLTKKGRALIAKILALEAPLVLSGVMVGSGKCENYPGDLESLVAPVAAGTSTQPSYDGDTIRLVVEYRSDLNGGLAHGFWLNEFGVYAADPEDGSPVLLFYGSLGDYPQWVSAQESNAIDTRRYPIAIHIGEGAEVVVDYRPASFLTAADAEEVFRTSLLPLALEAVRTDLLPAHNTDPEAHPGLREACAGLDARLSLLELMYVADVSGNPFTVTFGSLEGLEAAGVHNTALARLEF